MFDFLINTVTAAILGALIAETIRFVFSKRNFSSYHKVERTVEAIRRAIVDKGDADITRIIELDRYLLQTPLALKSLTSNVVILSCLSGFFIIGGVHDLYDNESTSLSRYFGITVAFFLIYGLYRLTRYAISQRNFYFDRQSEYLSIWEAKAIAEADLPQLIENRKWLLRSVFFPLFIAPLYLVCIFIWFYFTRS